MISPQSLKLWRNADTDLLDAHKERLPRAQGEKLIISMRSHEHQLFLSEEIQWFLEHGCQCASVGRIVPAVPGYPFKPVVEKMVDLRRTGDCLTCFQAGLSDPGKCKVKAGADGCFPEDHVDAFSKLNASLPKILLCSSYGGMMMDMKKFGVTTYCNDEVRQTYVNDQAHFIRACKLDDNFNEITRDKYTYDYSHPVPIQVGWGILQYSKHHMRRFVYDCLDKFIDRGSFKLVLTDTDSMVVGLAAANIDDCIKEELRAEWHSTTRAEFFPPHGTSPASMHAYRTPGLFKSEFEATHVVALAAKSYFQFNEKNDTFKISQKGVSKDQNTNLKKYESFVQILGGESYHATCNSIRTFNPRELKDKNNVSEMFTATLSATKMITAYYDKMYLHDDSIHCSPLDKWEPMTALDY